MSGSNDGSGGSGSWGSMFLKVADAVAALSSSSAAYEQRVAFGAQHEDEERDDGGRIPYSEKWKKPEIGWLKLNVDGSREHHHHNGPSAGCGGVLRDSAGKWVRGFSMKLDPTSNQAHNTELQAILIGLKLAREMNVAQLIVESDSKTAVDTVKNGLGYRVQCSAFGIVQSITKLRSDPAWQVKLVCVPRKANRVANWLANDARKLPVCDDLRKYDSAPGNCYRLWLEDNLGTNNNEMSGSNDGSGSKDGNKDGSESWGSFLKVAGAVAATVAVGGTLVAALSSSSAAYDDGGRIPYSEKWKKPELGSWKLNVDGSLDHNGPSAGCGGVLRDSSGKWLLGFSMNLDPKIYNQPHKTELQAILMGLKLAREMNVEKLIVESDSESVVSTVANGLGNKVDIVQRIRKLRFDPKWQVKLVYVPRTANRVANWLANDARKLPFYDDLRKYHSPPDNCSQLLLEDNLRTNNNESRVLRRNSTKATGSNDGSGSKDGSKDGSGSWGSRFLMVAGAAAATAAVAGGSYVVLSSSSAAPELEVPFGAKREGKEHDDGGPLKSFCDAPSILHVEEGDPLRWKKPEIGWVKLNVDGSRDHHKILSAGCGGVLRDPSGEWLHGFVQKLNPICEAPQIELQAILTGLELASKMELEKLVVESDCDSALSMLKKGVKRNHEDYDVVEGIRRFYFDHDWEVRLVSIAKKPNQKMKSKANAVADKLANYARVLPSYDLCEYRVAPDYCTELLKKDIS